MDKSIKTLCIEKEQELLNKYFPEMPRIRKFGDDWGIY